MGIGFIKWLFFVVMNFGVLSTGISIMSEGTTVASSYTATPRLDQDVRTVKTLNRTIMVYMAEQNKFPGFEGGVIPEDGEEISYKVYKELVDDMYLEESVLDSTTHDFDWETKKIDSNVKIVYSTKVKGFCVQIPQSNEVLMEVYNDLGEASKEWVVLGE